MTKALTLLLGLCMLVQVIKPLNVPGLRRRRDAWKIGVGAVVAVMIIAVIRPH
jgi:hypothetical protein